MKRMRKFLIGLLACVSVFAGSLGLAACGDGTESSSNSSNTESGTSVEQSASDSSSGQDASSDSVHEHEYTAVVIAPTCTAQGYTTHSCSCGDSYVDTYVNALDHDFKNYVSNGDAECEIDGTETAICERDDCEEKDTRTQENSALKHIYDKQTVETQYRKAEATCTSKAVYYKSCVCGVASPTETFEYGDYAEHTADNFGLCGVCGEPLLPTDGIVYERLSDGTAQVVAYEGTETKVRIAETYDGAPVALIGDAAFRSSNVTRIIIPDSVKSIDYYAFAECKSLASVVIGDGLTYIDGYAFYKCERLTNIELPDSLTYIDSYAFSYCDRLQYNEYANAKYLRSKTNDYFVLLEAKDKACSSYTIHNDTKIIASDAFQNCSSLTSIEIPDGVISIGGHAFHNCSSLTSVKIPKSVTTLRGSFQNCSSLTSIEIPEGITYIAGFDGCSSLTNIKIPDSVTMIDNSAFAGCSRLTSIEIPDGVTSIGKTAFSRSGLTSITIPDSVKSIDYYAFDHCEGLTSVTIGKGVKSIGYDAFYWCRSLTNITFNGTMAEWNAIEKGDDWKLKVPAIKVVCLDGEVAI